MEGNDNRFFGLLIPECSEGAVGADTHKAAGLEKLDHFSWRHWHGASPYFSHQCIRILRVCQWETDRPGA